MAYSRYLGHWVALLRSTFVPEYTNNEAYISCPLCSMFALCPTAFPIVSLAEYPVIGHCKSRTSIAKVPERMLIRAKKQYHLRHYEDSVYEAHLVIVHGTITCLGEACARHDRLSSSVRYSFTFAITLG